MNLIRNIFYLLVITGLLQACHSGAGETPGSENGAESPTPDARERMADIEWGLPEMRVLSEVLEAAGTVEVPPYSLGTVYAPVHGWVREVNHLPGQYVRKGERLTILEHPDIIRLQRDLLSADSRLRLLEKEFTRKRSLAGTEATSQRELEQAQSAYEQEQTLVESLTAELQVIGIDAKSLLESRELVPRLGILSPVSGYLNTVDINMGKLVSPDDLMFEIVDTRHVHLELRVYARDLNRIKKGQRVEARMPGSDSVYEASVHLIGSMVEAETKTALVHAHFEQEPIPIFPGTYMQTQVFIGEEAVMTLPQTALQREGETTYCFLREGDEVRRAPVETGKSDGSFTEIKGLDLPDGAEVALKGAYYLAAEL